MFRKRIMFGVLFFVFMMLSIIACAWTPPGSIDMMNTYNITNVPKGQFTGINLSGDYRTSWPTGGTGGGNTTEEMQDAVGAVFDITLNYSDSIDKMSINRTWFQLSGLVNASTNWANYNGTNTSQFENSNGLLHLIDSFLTSVFNVQFATKTTDDLTQGSTNLYENKSWNETNANGLYIGTLNSSVVTWNQANGSWNETKANTLYIGILNVSVPNWNSAYTYVTNSTFAQISEPRWAGNFTNGYNKTAWDSAFAYVTNGTFINYLNSSIDNWNKAYSYTTNGSFIVTLNSSVSQWANQTATDVQCGTSCISDAEVDDTITTSNYVRKNTWTDIDSYPAACASGTWVTTIGDTNTCTAPTAADVDAGTYPSGNYIYQGNVTSDGFKLGDNEKSYYGTTDNGTIYWNGTCMIMEVVGGPRLSVCK